MTWKNPHWKDAVATTAAAVVVVGLLQTAAIYMVSTDEDTTFVRSVGVARRGCVE